MSNCAEITATRQWIDNVVVDLNLCPFAKRELNNDTVRLALSSTITEEQLLHELVDELGLLLKHAEIETTLLIHPHVLKDFYDFNDFLSVANELLVEQGVEGIFQLASFHPEYQFAGVAEQDASNYTNRSPYPMLHILREESLSRAIDAFPDVGTIPERNVSLMNQMGTRKLQALLRACYSE